MNMAKLEFVRKFPTKVELNKYILIIFYVTRINFIKTSSLQKQGSQIQLEDEISTEK